MNKVFLSVLRPLIYFFVIITGVAIGARTNLAAAGIDNLVVAGGNAILFLVSLSSFLLTARSLQSTNNQAFVRAMYGSFMIKFFVIALGAFAYIMVMKKDVNKLSLGICALLYLVYTVLEVRGLNKLLKWKKNG